MPPSMRIPDTMWVQLDLTAVVIFLQIFLKFTKLNWLTTPSNMPPGPRPLPLVGNLLSMYKALKQGRILALMNEWRRRHGDIYTIWMGGYPTVIICDHKLMQEAFIKNGNIFSGTIQNMYVIRKILAITGIGVMNSDGRQWKELRRVTHKALGDWGTKTLEERVQEEASAVVAVMDKSRGRPVVWRSLMSQFSSNVVCNIIFGKRFEYTEPVFQQMTTVVSQIMNSPPWLFNPINFFWCFRLLPFIQKMVNDHLDDYKTLDRLLKEELKEHEASFDVNDIRDFVDLYLKARSESDDSGLYTAANMRRVIMDLFLAGTETSSTTMDWLILYMVAYPDVQARCQKEIDKAIGVRSVMAEDQKKLHFVEAVITEIFRIVTVAPLSLPRVATKAGRVGRYEIPQNTIIMAHLTEIHHDPEAWPNPDVFDPDRFLDKDGQYHQPRENYVPFSLGPRICPGESLARLEIFILFSTLMQTFTFSMDQGHTPDLQGHVGVTYSAKKQPVIAKRR